MLCSILVQWVPCHHFMGGQDGLQIQKLAVNILNKQSQTDNKCWFYSLVAYKYGMLQSVTQDLGLKKFFGEMSFRNGMAAVYWSGSFKMVARKLPECYKMNWGFADVRHFHCLLSPHWLLPSHHLQLLWNTSETSQWSLTWWVSSSDKWQQYYSLTVFMYDPVLCKIPFVFVCGGEGGISLHWGIIGFYVSHMYKSTSDTWIKLGRKFLAVFEFPSESLCGLLSEKLANIRAHLDHKPCKPIFIQFMMVNFILIWHLFEVMLILFELTYEHKNNIHHNSLCLVHADSKVDYWSCVLWRNESCAR